MNDVIAYDISYFKKHREHWYRVSEELTTLKVEAQGAKASDGALWTTLVPGFKQVHDEISELIIESLIGRGIEATREVGDKLETVARQYVAAEVANTAEADRLLQDGGF